VVSTTPADENSLQLVDWERLARAETHPLRVAILEMLAMDGGRTLSPKELTYELQGRLTTVNYHTTALLRTGLLRLAHERQVGGSMEHFYCLSNHSAKDLFDRL
jgi:DNA-binding transcriptional ArsR family regulator